MTTFRREFEQALPPELLLAPELGELLERIEEQSQVRAQRAMNCRCADEICCISDSIKGQLPPPTVRCNYIAYANHKATQR